jgi:hypothetical protein
VGIQVPPGTGKDHPQPGEDQNQGQEKASQESGYASEPVLAARQGVASCHCLTITELHHGCRAPNWSATSLPLNPAGWHD